jgi:hypothetical protein
MDVVIFNGGIDRQKRMSDVKWDVLSRSIGPYKVAHWIRKHGYTCQVIDFVDRMTNDQAYAAAKKFIDTNTKVVAVSTTFLTYGEYKWENGNLFRFPESLISSLRKIKQEYPGIKFALGGYEANNLNDWGIFDVSFMSFKNATEEVFLEYLDHITKNTPPPLGELAFPLFLIKNKNVKPRMHYHTPRNPVYNIEVDDFRFTKQDCILPREPLPLDVSRGCIFACKFCQFVHIGKKKLDYIRGMEYIEEEMRYNYDTFKTTNYYVLDDTFNDTEFKVKSFHDMVKRLPFDIKFSAYLRADLLERFPNMAILLKDAGLFGAFHGLESLHPEASKIVGKAWSGKSGREYIPRLFHDIWKGEVPVQTNFIVGLPGDTVESLDSTVDWIIDNNLHNAYFTALKVSPRFGLLSEFDKNAEKYGFTFPNDQEPMYWENGIWNQTIAKDKTQELNSRVIERNKVPVWYIPQLLWAKTTPEQILKTPELQLTIDDKNYTTRYLLDQYHAMLMTS